MVKDETLTETKDTHTCTKVWFPLLSLWYTSMQTWNHLPMHINASLTACSTETEADTRLNDPWPCTMNTYIVHDWNSCHLSQYFIMCLYMNSLDNRIHCIYFLQLHTIKFIDLVFWMKWDVIFGKYNQLWVLYCNLYNFMDPAFVCYYFMRLKTSDLYHTKSIKKIQPPR